MKLIELIIKSLFLSLLAIFYSIPVLSQDIIAAEYYVDGDPGFGNATSITIDGPTDFLDVDLQLPVDLTPGIHTLYIRTKDENGLWSISDGRTIYAYEAYTPNLTYVEYFIDEDPGFGNGTVVPSEVGVEIDLEEELSTQNIETGIHSVGIRTKNAQGRWSLTDIRVFHVYKSAQVDITEAEYWIGDDPGFGNGTPLPVSSEENNVGIINASIELTDLVIGEYILYVRVKNENGEWSLHEVIPFTICESFGAVSEFDFIQFNNTVSFLNNSQYATAYEWDFDDGNTSDVEEPAHFFNQPGVYNVRLIAANDCGIDTSYQEITVSSIDAIKVDKGGQGGLVTSIITGNGFMDESEVILCKSDGSPVILTPDTAHVTSIHSIIVTLNLAAAPLGYYDVKVINGLDTLTLVEGFEVIERVEPTFDIYISGPSLFRIDYLASFNVTIVNHGNVDGLLVPVSIGNIPWSDVEGEFNMISESGDYLDPRQISALSEAVLTAIENGVDSLFFLTPEIIDSANATKTIDALIPSLPPGSNSFELNLKSGDPSPNGEDGDICVTGTVSPPMIKNNTSSEASDCMATVLDCALKIALEISPAGDVINCINDVVLLISGVSTEAGGYGLTDAVAEGLTGGQVQGGQISSIGNKLGTASALADAFENCGGAILGLAAPWTKFVKFAKIANDIRKYVSFGATSSTIIGCLADSYSACSDTDENGGTRRTFKKFRVVTSLDPNLKSGPGVADDNYVNGFNTMSYTIQFENVDSASAAAQIVTIIDSLDISKFDLSTFTFLDYGFGNTLIPVNTGSETFTDILDLRPEMPNLLRVDGNLDTLSGVVTWIFTTLDTLTLNLTEDAIAGFLPPNVESPEGQGFVSFGIDLNDSVESGDIIENNAQIIFDTNEPIVTNTWDNGFDDQKPSSEVNVLPAITNDTIFDIFWGGTDDASGIRWYDIYMSINDSEYELIGSHIQENTMYLIGEYGDNFKFYSIATDKAGNIEDAPDFEDAETTLEMPDGIREFDNSGSWLSQTYPNPTNGIANVVYFINGSQMIDLYVTDMVGKRVKQVDKGLRDGRNEVQVDLFDLNSGIYFITLESENERITHKIILNK